jgi:uncharacterized protein (TIRG00374 family)
VKGQSRSKRPWLALVVQIITSLVLLAVLIRQINVAQLAGVVAHVDWVWLSLAFAAQVLGNLLIWPMRWSLMLAAYDVPSAFVRLIKGLYVGAFFGNFLPTSFGGDAYRAYWILDDKSLYRKSLFVVFLERLIGFVLLGFIAIPPLCVLLVRHAQRGAVVLTFAGVMVLVASGIVLLSPEFHRWLDRSIFRGSTLLKTPRDKLIQALAFLHASDTGKWQILCLSLLVQLDGIVFFFCIGKSLGVELDLWYYFAVVPPTVVATMLIPISFNGLGVREATLVLLTSATGIAVSPPQAVALGLLALMVTLCNSLLGGVFYVTGKGRQNPPPPRPTTPEHASENIHRAVECLH